MSETGAQVTTGTPISLLIENTDQRSKDYSEIKDKFRPGHADFTYQPEIRHARLHGGGRSSARETAARVAAGAVARQVIPEVKVRGASCRWGRTRSTRQLGLGRGRAATRSSAPDQGTAAVWEDYLDGIRKAGSSVGAVIEVVAEGVPPGWGAPIYGKLDGDLASAMMSINAVKGVEIGAGFGAAELSGERERRRDARRQ